MAKSRIPKVYKVGEAQQKEFYNNSIGLSTFKT